MNRRKFIYTLGIGTTFTVLTKYAGGDLIKTQDSTMNTAIEKLELSEDEWRQRLTPEQFHVLREEGTERPFTSALNKEYGKGTYHCAGCDLVLFNSETKFDSGTGWPSFYEPIDGNVGTKTDYKLIFPRTEYHCARCEGHQGHVFKDGPEPTGLRYCNNGVALTFKPENSA